MKIPKGILGGGSGKVGPVVAAIWKGIAYLRSLPSQVKNPRSKAQVSQRAIATAVGRMVRAMNDSYINPFLGQFSSTKKTVQNVFAAMNLIALQNISWDVGDDRDSAIAPPDWESEIILSEGGLETHGLTAANYDPSTGELKVDWDGSITGNGLGTDTAIVVVQRGYTIKDLFQGMESYVGDTGVVNVDSSTERSVESVTLNMPPGLDATTMHCYLVFYRDGDPPMISNSDYLQAVSL